MLTKLPIKNPFGFDRPLVIIHQRWRSPDYAYARPTLDLLEDARRLVQGYVEHYNNVRLHSAAGYITPKDMLAGRQQEIHAALSMRSHPGGLAINSPYELQSAISHNGRFGRVRRVRPNRHRYP